jgi:hypothetical protein
MRPASPDDKDHEIAMLTSQLQQAQADLRRAGDKNARLDAENRELNSQLNEHVLAGCFTRDVPPCRS